MSAAFVRPSAQRILALSLLAYVAMHSAWTVFHWGGPEVVAKFAGLVFVLPCLAATALAFRRARNEPLPSARHGWGLLAFAFALYSVGVVIRAYYIVSIASIPFPGAADPFFLVFPWIFFASLMALTREQLSPLDRRRVLLSTLVMVGAAGLIAWILLLRHMVAVDAATPFASVIAMLYPVGDLVMVGGLLFSTLLALGHVLQRYLLSMIAGAALFAGGNFVYAIQIADGTYQAGSPLDVTWTLGFVLFGIAALVPKRTVAAADSVQKTPTWLRYAPDVITGGLLLGALAILGWLIIHPDAHLGDDIVVILALFLIGTATYLRQRLELNENALLNRDLQAVNASLEARVEAAVSTLKHRNQELEVQTQESLRRTREVMLLNELGDLLQMCLSFEEASSVIARMGPHFFSDASGGLYLTSASRNLVERVAGWGAGDDIEAFAPEDCWALRRGRDHFVTEDGTAPRCKHLADGSAGTYLCVPLVAQGEALGLFHLHTSQNTAAWQDESGRRLARTVADAVALALSNLRLRETLRYQSIRDPLTGLFNRRYLEETFAREISRAARADALIGLVLFDINHFKRFNDTFGHEAGDLVLKELGPLIKERLREDDIACRYGGEEFVLVLPDITLEATRLRAEALREAAKRLQLSLRDQSLGQVSLSLGVAVYPANGQTAESLIRVADEALYRAKQEGRDRVVVAQENQVLKG